MNSEMKKGIKQLTEHLSLKTSWILSTIFFSKNHLKFRHLNVVLQDLTKTFFFSKKSCLIYGLICKKLHFLYQFIGNYEKKLSLFLFWFGRKRMRLIQLHGFLYRNSLIFKNKKGLWWMKCFLIYKIKLINHNVNIIKCWPLWKQM